MRSSLVLTALAALAACHATPVARSGQISCSAPAQKGTLWYGDVLYGTYEGQVGILEAYGNAELVAKYPNENVAELQVQVLYCNSTYLNATQPGVPEFGASRYAKLAVVGESNQCLGLQSVQARDVFLTKQDCSWDDDESQAAQFWSQRFKYGFFLPLGGKQPSKPWTMQFNKYDEEEVIANPPSCVADETCQHGQEYSFSLKT